MPDFDIQIHTQTDVDRILGHIPHAGFLGLQATYEDGNVITHLPFQDKIVGDSTVPALHGGVVGTLLEFTALFQLLTEGPWPHFPKPIDINIDYLRSGKTVDTFARAIITKQGRRVSNVRAEAWQADPTKPIATLHGHFMTPLE